MVGLRNPNDLQVTCSSPDMTPDEIRAALKQRIPGQAHIIDRLVDDLHNCGGQGRRGKPLASMLFVGPAAIGKSELTRALGNLLFAGPKSTLCFDLVDFCGPILKSRLLGQPPGFDYAKAGGQLTRPVIENPERFIIFEGIEWTDDQAREGVESILESIMVEGQLVEQGTGQIAIFTTCVLAITSRCDSQYETLSELQDQCTNRAEVDNAARSALRNSQAFRPEIVDRLDQIYILKPHNRNVNAENAEIAAIKIKYAAREYGVDLTYIAPELVFQIMDKADQAKDTRELTRLVETMFGELLIQARAKGMGVVRIEVDNAAKPVVRESRQSAGS